MICVVMDKTAAGAWVRPEADWAVGAKRGVWPAEDLGGQISSLRGFSLVSCRPAKCGAIDSETIFAEARLRPPVLM